MDRDTTDNPKGSSRKQVFQTHLQVRSMRVKPPDGSARTFIALVPGQRKGSEIHSQYEREHSSTIVRRLDGVLKRGILDGRLGLDDEEVACSKDS